MNVDTTPYPDNAPEPSVSRRVWRRIKRLALIVVGTYLVCLIMIGWLQAHLIYFPSRGYEITPQEVGLPFEEVTIPTADGLNLAAWFVPHERAQATVIFFHGNAGNIGDRVLSIEWLHRMGLNVLIFDYRGFGESDGSPNEQGLYKDAQAVWRYLTESRGVPGDQIILFGRSLGGAVAIELATRVSPAALIVESSFTRLVDVGRIHFPWLPVNWLLTHRYESVDKVSQITCPKLFIHGADDELIPIDQGRALFAAAAEPKEFMETPGGHNDSGFTYSPDYAKRMEAWIQRVLDGS